MFLLTFLTKFQKLPAVADFICPDQSKNILDLDICCKKSAYDGKSNFLSNLLCITIFKKFF